MTAITLPTRPVASSTSASGPTSPKTPGGWSTDCVSLYQWFHGGGKWEVFWLEVVGGGKGAIYDVCVVHRRVDETQKVV